MQRKNKKEKPAEEIGLLDDMLSALVEVLQEKGLVSQEEWERKIKEKLEKKATLKPFSELR